jgi:hypothetical protein
VGRLAALAAAGVLVASWPRADGGAPGATRERADASQAPRMGQAPHPRERTAAKKEAVAKRSRTRDRPRTRARDRPRTRDRSRTRRARPNRPRSSRPLAPEAPGPKPPPLERTLAPEPPRSPAPPPPPEPQPPPEPPPASAEFAPNPARTGSSARRRVEMLPVVGCRDREGTFASICAGFVPSVVEDRCARGPMRPGTGAAYDRTGASPRRFDSMSVSWSSTQSPGSRDVTIRLRPWARHERSSADIDRAR